MGMGNEYWSADDAEGDEQTSIYDERVGIRRLGFRNFTPSLERLLVPLDMSAESITSSGPPPWLVGSMYMLVPCVFDIAHWQRRWSWSEGGFHFARIHQPMPTDNECLKMLLHIEFLDTGQVQVQSRLLAPLALEEWKRAMGIASRLHRSFAMQSLSRQPGSSSLLSRLTLDAFTPTSMKNLEKIKVDAAVIQETLSASFPMGPYHGSDDQNRLVAHQSGLSRILLIDPISLASKQHISYTDLNDSFWGTPCARPCRDPKTRELFNVLVQYLPRKGGDFVKYQVVVLAAEAETLQDSPQVGRVVTTFMAPPTKLESFAVTTCHIIVPIHSLRYPQGKFPSFNEPLVKGVDELLEFQDDQDTLFYVISRESQRLVAVYRSEPSHVFSVVNAFDAPDRNAIYCDVIAADHPPTKLALAEKRRVEGTFPVGEENTLRRYCLFRLGEEMARFDGAAGQLPSFPLALFHHLTDYSLFAPLLAGEFHGTSYRYCYGLSVDRDNRGRPGFLPNALLKCDLASPVKSIQWHRAACYPSPPLLVPRPMLAYTGSPTGTTTEDDGVLLSLVLDVHGQRSIVMVLDAKDLRELARYTLPFTVPLNQHTMPVWIPARVGALGRGFWGIPTIEITPPEKTALSPIS